VAEQTVEGVRNAEDGMWRAWDARHKTLLVDVAMREETPREVSRRDRKVEAGRVRESNTLERNGARRG
jgi:hypothetical protein